MSSSVQQMLQRIVEGDAEARAWLFDTYAERLLRRLRIRYGDLDAEELLQESFVAYFRNDADILSRARRRLPSEQQTEARLERVLWDQACGIAMNHRRAATRRRALPIEAAPLVAGEPTPERWSVQRDTLKRLDRCLEAAGARIYLYYKLRYVDGLTPHEVSETTGWSRKTTYKLRQQLTDAAKRCAEQLELDR